MKMTIVRECEVSYKRVKRQAPPGWARRIEDSAAVADLFGGPYREQPHESFVVIAVDAKSHPIGVCEVARGGFSYCAVDIGVIARFAVLASASGVVLMHNHPSGDPTPSPDDVQITNRLRQGLSLLGIRVLDHVIVARSGYYSFRDAGLL